MDCFCTNCGTRAQDHAQFCIKCGAKIEAPSGSFTQLPGPLPVNRPAVHVTYTNTNPPPPCDIHARKQKTTNTIIIIAVIFSVLLVASGIYGIFIAPEEADTIAGATDSVTRPDRNQTPAETVQSNAPKLPGSGTLGDYELRIQQAELTKDYDGNAALMVTYSFTNHSGRTISFLSAINAQAFQDGVELESGIGVGENATAQSQMADVKPGATAKVRKLFLLANQTSDVDAELSLWFTSQHRITKRFMIQ